jgi:hypothetical protein
MSNIWPMLKFVVTEHEIRDRLNTSGKIGVGFYRNTAVAKVCRATAHSAEAGLFSARGLKARQHPATLEAGEEVMRWNASFLGSRSRD